MTIQTKAMTIVEMDEAGKGLALLATLSAIDSDDDTYQAGAFSWKAGGSQWAPMIVAHNRGKMPFGKARVYEDGDRALAELNLNLATQVGRDWHETLKFDLATGEPVQEWSYGYEVMDWDFRYIDRTRKVRVIKQTDVHEVSPVIRGAGAGTRTISIKSAELKDAHFAPLIASLGELATALGEDPSQLSATGLKQLTEIHGSLGKGLEAAAAAIGADATKVDTLLAGYLRHQSRRHLAA
ncbi:MAG: HK97 family phage prohead protease [Candidatus Sphingomonas phytovorans]|nr:HK97 family phage prohead protease [Sphingomonas sp.]WEK00605.1 MAG: HK97 family phage prohead protease [Sphingomonas sp.]